MKIAVINLAADAARWRAVERQFQAVGLEIDRREAVSGAELRLGQLGGLYSEQLNRRQYHQPLRSGEIGCYASHVRVWQQLLDSGERCAAVFEDDVEICADLPRVLESVAAISPAWDVVKLIGRRRENIELSRPLLPGRDLIRYRRVPSLTSAYVVSRRGAGKLLAARLPFGRPVDVDMRHWWECDLRIAGVHPYPVARAPSSGLSTIEDRRFGSDSTMRLQKLWLQARYSFCNWRALGNEPPWPARPRRIGLGRSADAPIGHDAR